MSSGRPVPQRWQVQVRSFVVPESHLVARTDVLRILGIRFSQSLCWSNQFSNVLKRAIRRMFIIRCLSNVLTRQESIRLYHEIVTSLFYTLLLCTAAF